MTNTTEKILEFISVYLQDKGFPPSIREIGSHLNITSTATVFYHLEKLEKMGMIKRDASKNRAIEIIGKKRSKVVEAPLIGRVAAGLPILAIENIEEMIPLPEFFYGNEDDLFLLKVVGESMINIGINDGDFIIVQKCPTASDGEVVVAMIDEEVTVKTFYKEDKRFRLQPENDNLSPIYCDELSIVGKVKGLFRKF